jgi:hypothetical protein
MILGNILEEFMDIAPKKTPEEFAEWELNRSRVVAELEANGLRYYRGGRVLPTGQMPENDDLTFTTSNKSRPAKPDDIEELLLILLKGVRRAMHPLTHRRKGAVSLSFTSEYDVQDLLHALLRPWIADIRPEEFTPSYAGSSTRMDFLLPAHSLVIELKFVRDTNHAKKIGDELIIDIDHYRRHPDCDRLWCVIYDLNHLLSNSEGLKNDLEGLRTSKDGKINVRLIML